MVIDTSKCKAGCLDMSRPCGTCHHNGVSYTEFTGNMADAKTPKYDLIADGVTIVQTQIVITKKCYVAVNAALLIGSWLNNTLVDLERPTGTDVTDQTDTVITGDLKMAHYSAWEVLDPGTYIYYLVNNTGAADWFYGAWINAVAADCEG